MKVYLAGFNVDTNVLHELEGISGKRDDITPEVISASYARISRDPRPINKIRESAKEEVEQSRKSNSTIIFKMGHHSVAEHAVFNLDIVGVSRYAMEELEKFRLCSYTEKSQRYITLDNDFVVPKEIRNTSFEGPFRTMVAEQNEAYFTLYESLKRHIFKTKKNLAADPKNHSLLDGWAKEDARYITALATESQVGLTVNARNLELMLRRFASNPLAEIQALGKAIYHEIVEVAPSIVLFHHENDLDRLTYTQLKDYMNTLCSSGGFCKENGSCADTEHDVQLVGCTHHADDVVVASLIHVSTQMPYTQCQALVNTLSTNIKKEIITTSMQNLQFYDSVVREFEYVNLTYNIVLSAACFGQLKRHRMSSQSYQGYQPSLGLTIPDSIRDIGMESMFKEIAAKTEEVYATINRELPLAAPYILTNAHRKRVLIRVNARELYHISRLREDAHSQWDIRNISRQMSELAKKEMPLICAGIGGKDQFNTIYRSLFGRDPAVIKAELPQVRTIKSDYS